MLSSVTPQLHGGRDRCFQHRQNSANTVSNLNDVGPRLAEQIEGDPGVGRSRIRHCECSLLAIDDGRDIGQSDWGSVAICNDQRSIFSRNENLVVAIEQGHSFIICERAFGNVCICGIQGHTDLIEADTELAQQKSGLTSARTPGRELPPIFTWPMPGICKSFCATMDSAAS